MTALVRQRVKASYRRSLCFPTSQGWSSPSQKCVWNMRSSLGWITSMVPIPGGIPQSLLLCRMLLMTWQLLNYQGFCQIHYVNPVAASAEGGWCEFFSGGVFFPLSEWVMALPYKTAKFQQCKSHPEYVKTKETFGGIRQWTVLLGSRDAVWITILSCQWRSISSRHVLHL